MRTNTNAELAKEAGKEWIETEPNAACVEAINKLHEQHERTGNPIEPAAFAEALELESGDWGELFGDYYGRFVGEVDSEICTAFVEAAAK